MISRFALIVLNVLVNKIAKDETNFNEGLRPSLTLTAEEELLIALIVRNLALAASTESVCFVTTSSSQHSFFRLLAYMWDNWPVRLCHCAVECLASQPSASLSLSLSLSRFDVSQ